MKTIYIDNSSESTQDIQEVKDELFDAIWEGKSFRVVQDDGDGDMYCTTWDGDIDFQYVEKLIIGRPK